MLAHERQSAEVVDVTVRDDDRVHVGQGHGAAEGLARGLEPGRQVRVAVGQPGPHIDQKHALLRHDQVGEPLQGGEKAQGQADDVRTPGCGYHFHVAPSGGASGGNDGGDPSSGSSKRADRLARAQALRMSSNSSSPQKRRVWPVCTCSTSPRSPRGSQVSSHQMRTRKDARLMRPPRVCGILRGRSKHTRVARLFSPGSRRPPPPVPAGRARAVPRASPRAAARWPPGHGRGAPRAGPPRGDPRPP